MGNLSTLAVGDVHINTAIAAWVDDRSLSTIA
jgi:hypothetical protein